MTKKTKITPQQIKEFKKAGVTQKKLARICRVTPQTIVRWKKDEFPFRKRKRKPKDYGIIPELLKSYIAKNNTITQNELADLVSKETGQPTTQQKIFRLLRKNNITYLPLCPVKWGKSKGI